MSGIFLIQENGGLVEMGEARYDSEALLQELLARYPNLLAGDQIESANPRRWLLVRREMPIPSEEGGNDRWSLDHLFLDQDAIPTLIEVKRSSDTRIRREVVGQMLDYAANAVVYWPMERLRQQFATECETRGVDPDQQIRLFLGENADVEEFWQNTKRNLLAGNIRMIFVADEIPRELRQIVEFLNKQMDPAEVLAIEIKQFVGQAMRTLVPKVIGLTAESEKKKGLPRQERQWDEEQFFAEYARRHPPEVVQACRKLYDLMRAGATGTDRSWGNGRIDGNYTPFYDDERGRQLIFNLSTNGKIGLNFGWVRSPPYLDESKRRELVARLNEVPGVAMPHDGFNRWPNFDLQNVLKANGFDKLVEVVDWAIRQITDSRSVGPVR